jgi:hypothetical protein
LNRSHLAIFEFNFEQTLTISNPRPYLPVFLLKTLQAEASLTELKIEFGYGFAPPSVEEILPKRGIKMVADCNLTLHTSMALQGAFGISADHEKYRM